MYSTGYGFDNERCRVCGGAKPASIIYGTPKMCRCGARRAALARQLERVDPAGKMTFDGLKAADKSVVAAALSLKAVAEGERERGVALFGLPGRGKTHLMVATVRALLQSERHIAFYNVAALVEHIQSTYGYDDSEETKEKIIAEIVESDVVALDDLGKEKQSADVDGILYRICDGLFNRRKTLLLSSNLPGEAFAGRYEDALLSRIGGLCEKMIVRGEDQRAKEWAW